MNKPKLGCDVDGVVMDFIGGMLPFINQRLGTSVGYEQLSSFNPCDCLGISPADFGALHDDFHAMEYDHDNSPIFEEAFVTLRELQADFELHFITAPPEWVRETRRAYLPRHFPGCQVHFTNGAQSVVKKCQKRKSKYELACELGLVAMIEDNPHEAEHWYPDRVPLIVHPQPWNEHLLDTHPHLPRLNWPETKEYLRALRADS